MSPVTGAPEIVTETPPITIGWPATKGTVTVGGVPVGAVVVVVPPLVTETLGMASPAVPCAKVIVAAGPR